MKQLFIQLNAVVVLLLAISFHCMGADTYTLKYNLEKGKTYKQHSITEMNMKMNAMGQDMEINMIMSIDINYDVTDKTSDGYELQMSYRRIKINMTSQTAYILDSDSTGNASDKNNAELLRSLIDVPIDIQMTEQGKVTSVKGVDKLMEKINTTSNQQFKQMFSQQFSETTIQQMIEQFSSYLPDKPVAINDSWNVDNTINANGVDIINKITLTLKQVTDNVAAIDLTGTLATQEGGSNIKVQGMDAKISANGTQSGTIQLNTKNGWIVRTEITQKYLQNIEVMGQSMPQQMNFKTTVTGE